MGAIIPRAHSRSRYDRFFPLSVLDREDVTSGLFSSIQSALCVEILASLMLRIWISDRGAYFILSEALSLLYEGVIGGCTG